jgi:hypothetical protein
MSKILVFTKTNDYNNLPLRSDVYSILTELSKKHEIHIFDNKKSELIYFDQCVTKSYKLNLLFTRKLYFIYNYISFLFFLIFNRNKYDCIQIFYVREEFLVLPFLLKLKANKINIFVYGSDFYVRNIIRDNFHRLYNFANVINFTNPILLREFNSFYRNRYEKKLFVLDFPFPHLELYKEFKITDKKYSKEQLEIDSDKIVLSIGTNVNAFEQHEKIIDQILRLKKPERFHLIFNLSYHGSKPNRCVELQNVIKSKLVSFKYSIFEGYQTNEFIAKIRLATDCLINLRETDQLVLSMLESNLAFSYVITGKWLPYEEYLNRVSASVINNFEELEEAIEKFVLVRNSHEFEETLLHNKNEITKRFSFEKAIVQWNRLYHN